jgi:prepilin-type N-terminal cleavage/methylation domain-containing protein
MTRRIEAEGGFTLIELLIVIVIIGILAAIVIPRMTIARERAHYATIASDIRNLGAAQERFFHGAMSYSQNLADLDFLASQGVVVDVTEATPLGWAAVGTHDALPPNRGCAIYLGNAVAPPLPSGAAHTAGSGVVQCTY